MGSLVRWFIASLNHCCFIDSVTQYFIQKLIQWVIGSLNHSCIASLTQCFTESSIHWSVDSLNHRPIDSLVHWFTDWLVHWPIDSLIHWFMESMVHWLVEPFSHCFVISLIHWFTDSLVHWFIDSLVHRLIHSVVHGFFHLISLASQAPFPHSLMHLTTSTTHGFCISKTNLPIGHWFLVVISYFRNFRPGVCRAPSGITNTHPHNTRVICFQNPDNMKSQPCKQAWFKKTETGIPPCFIFTLYQVSFETYVKKLKDGCKLM